MQLLNALTVSFLSLVPLSSARIYGISVPVEVAPGVPFAVSVLTQNYVEYVYDVVIAFGIQRAPGYPSTLGTLLLTEYIGEKKSNIVTPLTYNLTIGQNTRVGTNLTIVASLMSLYGANSRTVLGFFNHTIVVGDTTSEKYVSTPEKAPDSTQPPSPPEKGGPECPSPEKCPPPEKCPAPPAPPAPEKCPAPAAPEKCPPPEKCPAPVKCLPTADQVEPGTAYVLPQGV